MRALHFASLLALVVFTSGCQTKGPQRQTVSPKSKACRFEVECKQSRLTFRPSEDYSSPPGLYGPASPPQKLVLEGRKIHWGSWYLNGKVEQLYGRAGEQEGWFDSPAPLTPIQRTHLKELYPKGAVLGVPFKNPEKVLIRQDGPSYSIADLKSGKILWRDQGRYEAPTIDFDTDLLHCHGDLEVTEYTFDCDGQAR